MNCAPTKLYVVIGSHSYEKKPRGIIQHSVCTVCLILDLNANSSIVCPDYTTANISFGNEQRIGRDCTAFVPISGKVLVNQFKRGYGDFFQYEHRYILYIVSVKVIVVYLLMNII